MLPLLLTICDLRQKQISPHDCLFFFKVIPFLLDIQLFKTEIRDAVPQSPQDGSETSFSPPLAAALIPISISSL